MSDQTPHKPSLSEISHLFLSSVREKHTNGAPLPQRIAPGQPRIAPAPTPQVQPVEKMPEHRLRTFGEPIESARPTDAQNFSLPPAPSPAESRDVAKKPPVKASAAPRILPPIALEPVRHTPPVTAVLAMHLADPSGAVKEYARHLAVDGERIGLIEVDAGGLLLATFEAGEHAVDIDGEQSIANDPFDAREIAEALEELNWDVDRWLLSIPNPRTPEARGLLGAVGHWALLSTCDHDGVVASYRTLKGLAAGDRPRLSLACLNAADQAESDKTCQKLAGVCRQFLNWDAEAQPAVGTTSQAIETVVLCCRPARDKGEVAPAGQWEIVDNFLQSLQPALPEAAPAEPNDNHQEVEPMHDTRDSFEQPFPGARSTAPQFTSPALRSAAQQFDGMPSSDAGRDTHVEVIDLPTDGGTEAILGAILQQTRGELAECPVRAPMCDGARLAISRDHGIVLLAVAREGLSELRAIGHAYQWISENRALIAMAIPQFAIDPNQTPRLRLLVDHADASAGVLHQIMQAEHVTIQAYRKLRWGGRTGLFLEAA